MSFEIKPNKTVFVTFRFWLGTLGSFLFWLIISILLALLFTPIWFALLLIVPFFMVWRYYALSVRYKKRCYVFSQKKIDAHSGGILSDAQTELNIKNVTHVKLVLPWLEHKFFKTGHLLIQSAGSGGIEIQLQSIDNPHEVYNWFLESMQKNGFALKKKKLLLEAQPSPLAIGFEIFGAIIGAIFFFTFFIGPAFFAAIATIPLLIPLAFLAVIIILACGVLFAYLRYQDLRRRTYRVYDDTITYSEGFLTAREAFMPAENLSDAELQQGIIGRIFDLHDVKISCQGAGQEILFSNINQGDAMVSAIDNISSLKKQPVRKTVKNAAKKTVYDERFAREYRQNISRSLASLWVLAIIAVIVLLLSLASLFIGTSYWLAVLIIIPILFGIGVLAAIVKLIDANITRYEIKPRSIVQEVSFLQRSVTEFSNEKITGVIIRENPFDRMMNTLTITFWSIGSGSNIVMKHIRKDPELIKNILAKVGITQNKVHYEAYSRFSLLAMFTRALIGSIFLLALFFLSFGLMSYSPLAFSIPLLMLLWYIGILIYKRIFYGKAHLVCYEKSVHYHEGIFFHKDYFVLYNNIKNVTTRKYPFFNRGDVTFNVAGETIIKTDKGQHVVSNKFAMKYVDDIKNKDELFDAIFTQRPSTKQETQDAKNILVGRASAINTLIWFVPLLILLTGFAIVLMGDAGFMLVVLALAILLWVIVRIKMIRYVLQPYRIIKQSGILTKIHESVVFEKIDHVNLEQGPLNKLCSNGTIHIHTTGSTLSGGSELSLKNTKQYREFYKELQNT